MIKATMEDGIRKLSYYLCRNPPEILRYYFKHGNNKNKICKGNNNRRVICRSV